MDKDNYSLVQFNDYVSPEMHDDPRRNFVTWGHNNSFWSYLTELHYNSPTNAACINGIVKLAYGDGLVNPAGDEPIELFAKMTKRDIKRAMSQFYKTNKITLQVDYIITESGREISGVFYLNGERVALGKKDDFGHIRTIYYCKKDWNDKRAKKVPVPAFGYGDENTKNEIFFWEKPSDTDSYYGPVDYQGGLQYAELEVETANYHINLSHNGFTPSAIVNLNNGIPPKEQRQDIVRDIVQARTGSSNAGKIVVLFNNDSSNAATIAPYDIPDAHKQYEFISDQSIEKLFLAHNITSPLLLGLRGDGQGLGSNSDEIKEAYNLFNLMVLEPLRANFLEALQEIFPQAGALEFKQFDYFTEETTETLPQDERETNVQMASEKHTHDMSEDDEKAWMAFLEDRGEVIDSDDYIDLGSSDVGTIEEEQAYIKQFAAKLPGKPDPQDQSVGDAGLYKVRYSYGPVRNNTKSREFCKFMERQSKSGVVYRLEDIMEMSISGVNGDFAPQGQSNYNIFLYKGGVYCHHKWSRRVFFRKRNNKGQFEPASKTDKLENDKRVSIPQASRAGVPSSKLTPNGYEIANTETNDLPNRGSLKNG